MNFARVQTGNRELNQVQNNIATALQPLQGNLLLQGKFLTSVELANGTTTVFHNLGRPLVGWFVTMIDGAATIYDAQGANTSKDQTLVLVSSAAVTVNLYVF